jgi:HupE / UreJ protein
VTFDSAARNHQCRLPTVIHRLVTSSVVALVTAIVLFLPLSLSAHDIPTDVTVQMFVKPQGQHLVLLVRVPLRAMRDIDFPKRGPGNLDLERANRALRDAATMWISDSVAVYEADQRLAAPRIVETRASLPSDRSFGSYEQALAHVTGAPLPADTDIFWDQGMLDVLFEYVIRSERSEFALEPQLARLGLRVVTAVRFISGDGVVRAFELVGDPGLVRLDPRWHHAAARFVQLGFQHILDGTDHLLFLVCLVIPLRRLRPLVVVITAFTVAHSITLIASAYGAGLNALWFPPLIETLIAMSIVYMALENIAGTNIGRRWAITFAFGLVHGFGFSFALRQSLQFAGSHLLTSLLSFNIGVELGQLLVLSVLVPVLHLFFRFVVAERMGTIILSALVAHTAWHWMLQRGERLAQYGWPAFDAVLLASVLWWLMLIVVAAAVAWLAFGVVRAIPRAGDNADAPTSARPGS